MGNYNSNLSNFASSKLQSELIGFRDSAKEEEYLYVLHYFSGFYVQEPTLQTSGKLQLKFLAPMNEIINIHCEDFSQFPQAIQNNFKALDFLIACFKYHGFCKSEDNYPILEGAGLLETHVGLYDNQDFVILGHTYDNDEFLLPRTATPESLFANNVKIHENFCEASFKDCSEHLIKKLVIFLKNTCKLRELISPLKSEVVHAPHNIIKP
ncbi:MAG: hypothetical protein CMF49_04135 [Legionellales bacterium]|nr:hypothetical protein [Legionellales bacterium]|tara:strand:+ start:792 stop:1421 length:630 start_codon:yes stop_codon:yes gene_type:complete